jgi:hypothetical protein
MIDTLYTSTSSSTTTKRSTSKILDRPRHVLQNNGTEDHIRTSAYYSNSSATTSSSST